MHHNIKQIQHRFDRAAASYDDHAQLQQQVLNETAAKAEPYIDDHACILDAGCGTGQLQSRWRNKHATIFSLDLAASMCAETRSQQSIAADFHALPIKDNSLDVYFSSLAWQWSANLNEACNEAYRSIKENGTLIISTLLHGTLAELQTSFKTLDGEKRGLTFHTEDAYVNALRNAHFQMIASEQTPKQAEHSSVRALLHNIKGVGASHSTSKQPLTKTALSQLESIYPKTDDKIVATWQIGTFIAQKRSI